MNVGLSSRQKIILVVVCFVLAVIGFMVKLPSSFRHVDKELHAAFYFLAAAFLNILFAGKNFVRHAVIFVALYLFGMAIEYGQDYSNKVFHNHVHGRFDPEDVQWNLKGLLLFSAVWLLVVLAMLAFRKSEAKESNSIP